MLAQKTGAAPTAPKTNRRTKPYKRYVLKSSTKIKDDLGELLWSLQFSIDGELGQRGWQTLERLLSRYIGIVHTRGAGNDRKRE